MPGWVGQINTRVLNKLELKKSEQPVITHVGRYSGQTYRPKKAKRPSTGAENPLAFLKGLAEDGNLTPAVDKTFQLEEVPAAISYLVTGEAAGKIVITV